MVKIVASAVASVLLNEPTTEWRDCQKAMNNPSYYVQALQGVPDRMDQGEDFSKVLKQVSELVKNPDVTPESAKKNSATLGIMVEWLRDIVQYGSARQPRVVNSGSAKKSNQSSAKKSPARARPQEQDRSPAPATQAPAVS